MSLRGHHIVAALLIGAVVLASVAWFGINPPTANATCASGSSVVVTDPGSTTTNSPLTGIHTLHAQSTPTTASSLTFMLTSPTQMAIGEAVQNGPDWQFAWDTRNVPNGSYQMVAIGRFGTATSLDCASAPVAFAVQNTATQVPTLKATINPGSWNGGVNQSVNFALDILYTDKYGRQSHVAPNAPSDLNWTASIGAIQKTNVTTAAYAAGSTPGNGTVTAAVIYNGISTQAVAPIQVSAPSTTATTTPKPTTAGTATPAPSSLPSDLAAIAAMPSVFRPANPTNSAPTVALATLKCMEQQLGKPRFQEISSGKTSPTPEERRKATTCFKGAQPIPSVLAPVAPNHVTDLPLTTDVTLGSIKNQTITNDKGTKVTNLLLSGTAAPNSLIFIYIFSDPLVLQAQTDGHGAWKYVLENPLKPGKHEVYAVSEKDQNSFVRTSAVPISIAAATPGGQDGSLVVERQLATQVGFLIAAGLMVLAAIGILVTLLRRRRPLIATEPQLIQPAPAPSNPPPNDPPA